MGWVETTDQYDVGNSSSTVQDATPQTTRNICTTKHLGINLKVLPQHPSRNASKMSQTWQDGPQLSLPISAPSSLDRCKSVDSVDRKRSPQACLSRRVAAVAYACSGCAKSSLMHRSRREGCHSPFKPLSQSPDAAEATIVQSHMHL